MDKRELVIFLPMLPDRRLGPNRSKYQHWGLETAVKNQAKSMALIAFRSARNLWERQNKTKWVPLVQAELDVRIYVKDGRKVMDDDNTRLCIKCIRDMLQEKIKVTNAISASGAGIITNDKRLNPSVNWVVSKDIREGMWWNIKEV